MTPPLYAPLAETFYYICFGQKFSCLHIVISGLLYLVLHILDIPQLIFDHVYLYMHAKMSMWSFKHNLVFLPLLWMDIL